MDWLQQVLLTMQEANTKPEAVEMQGHFWTRYGAEVMLGERLSLY